jgi:hypothetical protein
MAHARKGGYRDWQAIDRWATAIARDLQQNRVEGRSPQTEPQTSSGRLRFGKL